jgi:hypothetical protein
MAAEQRIRAVLFYLSLLVFLVGLPFILASALGYKFIPRAMRFTRTGIIDLKSQPAGAKIYLDGRDTGLVTPATLAELLPAKYAVRLELKGYFPWPGEAIVDAGQVARLDKIILFPLKPRISQLNKEPVTQFWVDSGKGEVYYLDDKERVVFSSDEEGEDFREIGGFPALSPPARWKVSPDREKLLCFNGSQIAVTYLEGEDDLPIPETPAVIDYPGGKIRDIFWHSDSYHLLVVTPLALEALEVKPQARAVRLAVFSAANPAYFYDSKTDAFYFLEARQSGGKLFRMDLSQRSGAFEYLLQELSNA